MALRSLDLMVGDFIRTIYAQKIIKVREIKQSCIYTNDNGYEYNEIEPIPISPEILEKNGFEMVLDKDKLPTYRIKWTCNPNLYFTVFTGVDGYWNSVGFGVTIAGVNGAIDYVHQLQHAMKLCGINKEIVL